MNSPTFTGKGASSFALNGSTPRTVSRRLTMIAKHNESKPKSSSATSSDSGPSRLSCSSATCWNWSRICDRTPECASSPLAVFLARSARVFPRPGVQAVCGSARGRMICSMSVRSRITPSNRSASGSTAPAADLFSAASTLKSPSGVLADKSQTPWTSVYSLLRRTPVPRPSWPGVRHELLNEALEELPSSAPTGPGASWPRNSAP